MSKASIFSGRTGFFASLAATALLAAGCDGCPDFERVLLSVYGNPVSGAKLSVGAGQDIKEGKTITVVASGQLGDGKLCPDRLYVAYASDERFDQFLGASTPAAGEVVSLENPPTERVNGACRLKPVTRQLQLAGIVTGSAAQRRLNFTVELAAGKLELNPNQTPKTKPTFAVADVDVFVGRDFNVNPGPTGPTGPTGPNTAPKANLVIGKLPQIQGSPTPLDARASTDADGSIVRYDFEWDGDPEPEQSGTSPSASAPGATTGTKRVFAVTVFDERGASNRFAHQEQEVQSTGLQGDFEFTNDAKPPSTSITVTTKDANQAVTANLDTDEDGFDDGSVPCPGSPNPCAGSFAPFTFATAGFKLVGVRYESVAGTTNPQQFTEIYKLIRVTAAASAASTRARSLVVPIKFSRAKLVKLGAFRLGLKNVISSRNLLLNGRVSATLPKTTTRAQRTALAGLARGKFAASLTGSLPRLGAARLLAGQMTVLIRSRADAKTQMCLRFNTRGTRTGSYSTLGATGKAAGYSAAGALPSLTIGRLGLIKSAIFSPRKGRAKSLPAACRALVKSLPK